MFNFDKTDILFWSFIVFLILVWSINSVYKYDYLNFSDEAEFCEKIKATMIVENHVAICKKNTYIPIPTNFKEFLKEN